MYINFLQKFTENGRSFRVMLVLKPNLQVTSPGVDSGHQNYNYIIIIIMSLVQVLISLELVISCDGNEM